jgi:hypothetical protein
MTNKNNVADAHAICEANRYLAIPLFSHACDKITRGGDSRGAKDVFH